MGLELVMVVESINENRGVATEAGSSIATKMVTLSYLEVFAFRYVCVDLQIQLVATIICWHVVILCGKADLAWSAESSEFIKY